MDNNTLPNQNNKRNKLIDSIKSPDFEEVQNGFGMSVLMIAARDGDLEICKLLIEKGVDCLTRDINNMDALFYAVSYEHHDIVRFFIERKIFDLNASYQEDCNCLIQACLNCDHEMVSILIESGVDINIVSYYMGEKLPLAHCVLCNISCVDPEYWDDPNDSLTSPAFLTIQVLADAGVNMNLGGQQNEGLIFVAMETYGFDFALKLLEMNVDINHKDIDGDTALHLYAQDGNFECCKFLVDEMGADLSAKNNLGKMPFEVDCENDVNKDEFNSTKDYLLESYNSKKTSTD